MPADTGGTFTVPDGFFAKQGLWVLPPAVETGRTPTGTLNITWGALHLLENESTVGAVSHAVGGRAVVTSVFVRGVAGVAFLRSFVIAT